jgi:hypothetical protein
MKQLRRFAPTLSIAALSVLCLPLISGAAGSTAAAAADSAIFVTTTAQLIGEDGECSLQEAIHAANFDTTVMPDPGNPGLFVTTGCTAGDGADTIQLPPGGTFTLSRAVDDVANYIGPTATPIVTSTITIEALGAKILHGGGPFPYRAFAVAGNGNLTISEAYIKGFEVWGGDGRRGGGGGLGAGGAVYVQGGQLTVEKSTFEQNGALGGDGASLPEAGATAGGGGGGLGGNGGGALGTGISGLPRHGGGGGGSRANGGDGGDINFSPSGYGGGRLASGRTPCGGEGGDSSEIVGGGGEDGECAGGGGGGAGSASTAFDLAGTGGNGHYGGGGGGGGCCAGDGGDGGFGGGGGGSGITTSDEGGGGDGGDGGFGAGAGAGPDEPLTPGGGGQGGTFGGDAGLIHGGGGAGLGGAIFGHNANITVTNITFFNNYANRGHAGGPGGRDGRGAGGAIFLVGGSLAVVHATLSGNATGEVNADGEGIGGGGIVVYKPTDGTQTSFFLKNTVLAGNGIHECYTRNNPSFNIQGNLILDGSAPSVPNQTHDPCPAVVTIDPGLEPLKLTMPGRTPTMALPPGSSAIDAAVPFGALPQPFDQRGVQRPAGFEDIGAFEAVALAPVTTIALSPAVANGANGWYTGDPVGVSITAVDDGTVAETRCALDQAPAPASFDELPIGPCGLTSVGSDGLHTIYAASRDTNGTTEGPPVSVSFKVDRTAPSLSPSLSASPVVVGQTGVTASPNASDSPSGVASSSCGSVDSSTPGPKTLTCSATDNAGNARSVDLEYVVEYRILGFFDPVPGSKWKVGMTVPIKIALGNADGIRVSDAVGRALAANCRVRFSASGAQTKSAECMKYDSEKNQFVYAWKLGKTGTGAATIRVTIGYPGTTSTTQKTLPITITK